MNGASAEVLTKFTGNTKDLDSKTNSAKGMLSSFASGVGKAFKASAVAIGAVSTAIGVLVKQSVDAYAEFEQLEGGLEALFGKGSNEMNSILAKSETAWKDLTMSQNDYLTAFESSYSLVKNGLADESKAIDYTNKVLQLSSDLFNTYGKSTEYYQGAIEWALKGTFSYLDNLQIGIKGTAEGFVEAANKSGILGRSIKDVKELTNEEIVDVIQHYAEAAGAWGRTQKEASDTIIGSLNMTKATWSNLVAGFSKDGADMNKLIDNFVTSAMTFANNLLPVIERALNSIGAALPKVVDTVGKLLPGLLQNILPILLNSAVGLIDALIPQLPTLIQNLVPPLIDGFITLVQSVLGMLPTLIPVILNGLITIIQSLSTKLPTIIQLLLDGLLEIIYSLADTMPTLIPLIVQAVLDIIPVLLNNLPAFVRAGIELIIGLSNGLIEAIPIIIDMLPTIIEALINGLVGAVPQLVLVGPTLMLALGKGLIKAIPQLVGKVPQIVKSIVDGFRAGIGTFNSLGGDLLKGLWNGINGMKNWVVNKVKDVGKSILNGIKGVLGIHSPSTEFAMIGKFSVLGYTEELDKMTKTVQGQIAETFSVSPQLANSSSLHYSPNVVVNTVNNISQDPLGRMVNDIKTFSGGAKNDYNYGMGV
jgi:phage-related protein